MGASRCFKARIDKNVFNLTNFGVFFYYFAIDSSKLVHFGQLQKFHYSAENAHFCVRMDASRCLKGQSAENVFTLTNFVDFSKISR